MTDLINTIATLAEELADARQHREPVYEWTAARNRKLTRVVVTTQPGLIEQLRDSVQPASTGEQRRSVPTSRPPLQLEALDRLIAIERAATGWTRLLQEPPRLYLEATIRALVGAASRADVDLRHALAADMRRWRGWAAVMTGWASPPMSPYVPCPNCNAISSLRILPERRSALCSKCDHVWDDTDGSLTALGGWIIKQADSPPPRLRLGSAAAGHGGWQSRDGGHPVRS